MSDKVIRITSQQGYAESWLNATGTPTSLNLLDFVIPRGLKVDLSKSYISINTQITNDSGAPINADWYLDVDGGNTVNVPNSALVRNCHISNDRGQVESIRRNDSLTCALWSLTNTAETRKNDMNVMSAFESVRGVNNKTSYQLDCVTNNVSNDGTTVETPEKVSRMLNRDLKIMCKDVFGVCNAEAYSTDIFGETRMHLEMNMDKLKAQIYGGEEGTSLMFDNTNNYGDFVDIGVVTAGSDSGKIETKGKYGNWQLVFPFFVGQEVVVTAASTDPAGAITETRTIKSIQYQTDNSANPPTGNAEVFVDFTVPIYSNGTANPHTISDVVLNAKVDQALTNVVNRAEVVLFTIPGDMEMPEQLEFPTYTTELDNGIGLLSFNKQYMLEPEADAWFVACMNQGQILPNKVIESYRFAIDQEEMTGNRDVITGQPIQFDRLQRCLDRQVGLGWRNAQMKFYQNSEAQATAYSSPVTLIAETAEEMPMTKMLGLNIECAAGLSDIAIYKHMIKTI